MKPRNKYERLVVSLSAKLPPLTPSQKEYAIKKCNQSIGYYSGNKVWCIHCGHVFDYKADNSLFKGKNQVYYHKVTCPHCREKLTLYKSRIRSYRDNEGYYFSIITTIKGWQVCRHFLVTATMKKGEPCSHTITEVVQNWNDGEGHEALMKRGVTYIPYYGMRFTNGPITLGDVESAKRSQYLSNDFYSINPYFVYPRKKVLPILKRNGFEGSFRDFPPNELFKMLLEDREAEMLFKNEQYAILWHKYNRYYGEFQTPHQEAIRIAIRNKYKVQDASIWFDYLDLLEYFRKDLHNAFYVCPDDLKAAHDYYQLRKKKIEERKSLEEKRAKAAKYEKKYKKEKGKFFGISFESDGIRISVISSVREMAEEGVRMHHCVYDNEYFKKKDSLILSAKDLNGERLETIEVNLKTFQIVQSQGHCNKNSERHDDILQLMKSNINLIKSVA